MPYAAIHTRTLVTTADATCRAALQPARRCVDAMLVCHGRVCRCTGAGVPAPPSRGAAKGFNLLPGAQHAAGGEMRCDDAIIAEGVHCTRARSCVVVVVHAREASPAPAPAEVVDAQPVTRCAAPPRVLAGIVGVADRRAARRQPAGPGGAAGGGQGADQVGGAQLLGHRQGYQEAQQEHEGAAQPLAY